jgi:hypothetical protein
MHCRNGSGAPTTAITCKLQDIYQQENATNTNITERTFNTHQSTTKEVDRPVAKDVKTCQKLLTDIYASTEFGGTTEISCKV